MKASAKQMPALSRVTEALRTAGFEIIGNETFLVQPDLKDFFLYSGKYDPAMYLDPKVRSGISTFANLASQEEIEEGCRRLQQDIMDGKIKSILNTYSSDHGDYAFIVAEKRTI
ncbi:hypothetical protein [Caldalkalibacillus mannanilyticus]|uniref:hypothetical protein n=1 Tax=Caldalkalibacillus mannanilyticus TaxID=1418 RepID=UPI000AE400D5|nr:hypothetical protein [Caldalkalibacillus mannanilyticus]